MYIFKCIYAYVWDYKLVIIITSYTCTYNTIKLWENHTFLPKLYPILHFAPVNYRNA